MQFGFFCIKGIPVGRKATPRTLENSEHRLRPRKGILLKEVQPSRTLENPAPTHVCAFVCLCLSACVCVCWQTATCGKPASGNQANCHVCLLCQPGKFGKVLPLPNRLALPFDTCGKQFAAVACAGPNCLEFTVSGN